MNTLGHSGSWFSDCLILLGGHIFNCFKGFHCGLLWFKRYTKQLNMNKSLGNLKMFSWKSTAEFFTMPRKLQVAMADVLCCAGYTILCCVVLCWGRILNTAYYLLSNITESKHCHHNVGLVREDSKGIKTGSHCPGIRQHSHRPHHLSTGIFVYLNGIWRQHFSWHLQLHKTGNTIIQPHKEGKSDFS